ncbi:hypothetical protein [uncultured Polaribacter sp.]|uniref:hypothetical protein n=1 Tax=uncultured Polaribacter sp. TaxID=174711 RepID=UPI002619F006|nr:hypothetical protein [uncultured Polaribacter sp.]
MYKKLLIFMVFLAMFSFEGVSQEKKLENAKQSLKSNNSTNNSGTKTSKTSTSSTTVLDDDDDLNPFARIIFGIAAYTFYGVMFETPWEFNGRMHSAEFSNYPYKESNYGNFIYTNSTNYNIVRLDVYNHFLIENKQLYGNDIGVDFKFFKRFALDVNYTTFLEKVNNRTDTFNMFSALLKYHRIRTQRFNAWFGVGFRSIFNNVNETRFLLGIGGELFLAKPISVFASHKWATINQQSVRNSKLLLKYHLKNYRITFGYEHYKLAVSEIKAFSLGFEASF